MMNCNACGARIAHHAKFCTGCGSKVKPATGSENGCRACGAEINGAANFCTRCGTPVERAAVPAEAQHVPSSADVDLIEASATPVSPPVDGSRPDPGFHASDPNFSVGGKPMRRSLVLVTTIGFLCVLGVGVYTMRSSAVRVANRAPDSSRLLHPGTAAVQPMRDPVANGMERSPMSDAALADAQPNGGDGKRRPRQGTGESPREKQERESARFAQRQASSVDRNAERLGDRSAVAGATARGLVAAAITGDTAALQNNIVQLQAQQPARGDRKRARQLNDQGLALFQRANYRSAAEIFRQAHRADGGDAEIRENLGYSLMQAGELAEAERALLSALEIAPQRATAWGSLGHIYAKHGKHREAVALLLTAYRFAADRSKALEVYARQAETDDDPNVRAMLAESVTRLSRTR
jgi:Flp pilus assembly protein TadD